MEHSQDPKNVHIIKTSKSTEDTKRTETIYTMIGSQDYM